MGTLDYLLTSNSDHNRKVDETKGSDAIPCKKLSTPGKLSLILAPVNHSNREKRRRSMVELLNDLYDNGNGTPTDFSFGDGGFSSRSVSMETDSPNDDPTMTNFSAGKFFSNKHGPAATRYSKQNLHKYDIDLLRKVIVQLKICISKQNQLLVCYLKRKDHQMHRLRAKCDMVTAILQALSPKRSVDAKLQFTPDPLACESGYAQWLNGMKAVARLPDGMPEHFRQKLWVTLSDHYVKTQQMNWDDIKRWAFNDRMNPDDDELSLQIVKDLHRTGWSGLDGDKERIILRRVLLAYARYNKSIGYCQGFNVIVAIILEITGYNEEQAFKVTVMLLEHVLPASYFDQTLRALSVDMAVLRDLMQHRLPRLSAHLDSLQRHSESEFEPPLVNVFSMQWFLTLFATCLPKRAVHRIWDSLMLEGSEILLRTALALWARIGKRLIKCKTADSFYTQMGLVCQEWTEMSDDQCNDVMSVIYSMADFPYPGLDELRDRHMFNIQPFSSTIKLLRHQAVNILKPTSGDSSDEGPDGVRSPDKQKTVINMGAANAERKILVQKRHMGSRDRRKSSSDQKTKSTDLNALEKQYRLLRQRQKQAAVVVKEVFTNGIQQRSNLQNGRCVKNYAQVDVFNHLQLKQPKRGVTINTCTLNRGSTVPLPMASKIVQPSGKSKRQNHQKSSLRRESSSSTASSVVSRCDLPILNASLSKNAAAACCDDRVRKFLSYPHRGEMPIVQESVEKRRRSLDNMQIWSENREHKLLQRRSNSCMELHWKMPDSKSQGEEQKLDQETIVDSCERGDKVQAKYHNPFPTRKKTNLIERGKRLGLYS